MHVFDVNVNMLHIPVKTEKTYFDQTIDPQ